MSSNPRNSAYARSILRVFVLTLIAAGGRSVTATEPPAPATEATPGASEAAEAASEKYLLRYRFAAGEELRYASSQTLTQQQVAPAGQKLDVSKVEQDRVFHVTKVLDNGDVMVSMQFEHVRMELKTNDQDPVVFDSTMPDADVPPQFRGAADQLKGAAATFRLRPEGTPVSDDGVEESQGSQASFMMPLPQEPIAVGDSWKVRIPVKVRLAAGVLREVRLLRTYKLVSVEDETAMIRFFTSIESAVRSPQEKGQLLQATPNGSVEFDITGGRVVKRELRFDKAVLGALGTNTILSSKGLTVERLVLDDGDAKVSAR